MANCVSWEDGGYGCAGSIAFRNEKGVIHRDLGYASIDTDGTKRYVQDDGSVEPGVYWSLMYKKYKGTEHEQLCVANMLGAAK